MWAPELRATDSFHPTPAMLTTILNNLTNIGWAMLIFLCAYLSNVAFSLYYNIKVLL